MFHYKDGSVSLIFQVKNKVYYESRCAVTDELIELLEEPYDEAFKKVQQNPSVEKKSEDYKVYVNQIANDFALEMEKEFGLIWVGIGAEMSQYPEIIDIRFIAYQRATIDQARELEIKAIEKLLQRVNNHEKIRSFLREHSFKVNGARVSISFRKELDDSRYSDGSVAIIFQDNNKVYYQRNCAVTNESIDLYEESYDEALKKVQNPSILKKPIKSREKQPLKKELTVVESFDQDMKEAFTKLKKEYKFYNGNDDEIVEAPAKHSQVKLLSPEDPSILKKSTNPNESQPLKKEYKFYNGNDDEIVEASAKHSRIKLLSPEDPLKGKILNGNYYSPKNIFSCQADNFGEYFYIVEDAIFEIDGVGVGFYSPLALFKKAEVFIIPGMEKKEFDRKSLFKDVFDNLILKTLKGVNKAEGMKILSEEMMGDMFFAAISIEKRPGLTTLDGRHMSSTCGYLIFQDKDKLAIFSNQKATFPIQTHTPKKHVERLKKEILEFKNTFQFGSTSSNAVATPSDSK